MSFRLKEAAVNSTKNYFQFSDIMATSKLVLKKLDELGIPYQTLNSRRKVLRKKTNYGISIETSTYMVAAKEGIDVHRLLAKEGKQKELEDFKTACATYDFGNSETKRKPIQKNEEKKNGSVKSPFDIPLSQYNIDAELVTDCKIQKPYRKAVSEAMLTLETRIRSSIGVDETFYGEKLIAEAKRQGVFKRKVQAEEDGLYFMYMGAIKWLRNPSGHRKINYTKEDSVKMVLYADYLIKLFDDLVNKRI